MPLGVKARVFLACERSGQHKHEHGQKRKMIKQTGSKNCGFPFALRGKKLDSNDDWMLEVVSGVHNHSAAEHLEGHSLAGILLEEKTKLMVDMSKSMIKPKEILVTLKQISELNVTIMKTIYNARYRYKVNEQGGRS